jgi:dCMP deaminase
MIPNIAKHLAECDRVSYVNLCTQRDVGAVVVKCGDVVSVGRNTMPGHDACVLGGCPRGAYRDGKVQKRPDYSDCVAVHAEMNALLRAGTTQSHGAILVVNSTPCYLCTRLARGAGIIEIVYRDQSGDIIEIVF